MAVLNFDENEKFWTSVDAPPLFNPSASLGQIILHALKTNGTRVAQISAASGMILRYDEILSKSIRAAQHLKARGYHKGQLVGIVSPNTHLLAPIVFASLYLGCPVGAADERFEANEMKHTLSITQPALMFCERSLYAKVRESLDALGNGAKIFTFGGQIGDSEPVESLMVEAGDETSFVPSDVDAVNDVAMITCSSGTTGFPKAICHSHAVLADNITRLVMYRSDDVTYCACSLHWIAGARSLIHGTLAGAKRLISEQIPSALQLRMIEQYKVTCALISAKHTMEIYRSGLLKAADLSSIRCYFIGAGSIAQSVLADLNNLLPNGSAHVLYGLSETTGTIAADFPGSHANGSVGRFRGGVQAKLVDEGGKRCGIGAYGELCVKGSYRFLGYYGNQAATDELFDCEGFIQTGDIGHIDRHGFLYIIDRKKDMILYTDFRIYPSAIESHLLRSALIESVCVVGIPHVVYGELVAAAIVPGAGATVTEAMVHGMVDELSLDYCKLRGGVHFMDSMPTTPTGKIVRGTVKKLIVDRYNQMQLANIV